MVGPRRALACLLFVTCPPIIGIMFVPKFVDDPNTADAWIACRSFIGIGLATFVTSQVWCAQMFNKKVVGIVNATSAGWGNLGGGVTNLTMPLIFSSTPPTHVRGPRATVRGCLPWTTTHSCA